MKEKLLDWEIKMEKYRQEEIRTKIIKLCNLRNCNNAETIANCYQIIDKYLANKDSSLDILFNCLDSGIHNNSWLLAWQMIREETDKLSGKYYAKQEQEKIENETILLNYEPLNLGERIFSENELQNIKVNLGIIDTFGTFHTSERLKIPSSKWPDHRKLASYLHLKEKIIQYYIRVGCFCDISDDLLCPESIQYGDKGSLKKFVLTEKMAIALYNSIMSKKNRSLLRLEEKLAFYGTEYGYYSTKYDIVPRIYDYELYEKNMKVLSRTLEKRFDKQYFDYLMKH